MKKYLPICLRSLLCGLFLLMSHGSFASHIVGVDLNYQYTGTGNKYQITLVVYGDCSGTAFPSLDTARPQICIYNGGTSVGNVSLTIDAALSNIAVAPVCIADTGLTTCSGGTLIGIKKFTYTGTYTLPTTSHVWRFIFDGNMGGSAAAGRAASITNINNPGATITVLVDTLDNTAVNNSSPVMSVLPTPYYCLNNADDYNPGATDPDGDSLHFYLAPGLNNTAGGTTCAGGAAAASVTYLGTASATNPLTVAAGSFTFNPLTGQIDFNPNSLQRSLVVYSIREYRAGVLVGTSQREMTFLVQTCTNTPPYGGIASSTGGGAIIDSTHYQICTGGGPFTLTMHPTEALGTASITVTASGLPSGSTLNVVNNGTPTPVATFSWTATGPVPGLYTFYLVYQDNNCPIAGQSTYAFNVTINSLGVITGTPTVCVGATTNLSNSTPGGTWSSSNGNATVGSGTGIVTGVTSASTATISYSVGTCFVTDVVTVNLSPGAILGVPKECVGTLNTLSDSPAGGTWTSSATGVATVVGSTGVVSGITAGGQTFISYTLSDGCYAFVSDSVLAPPTAILGTLTVCTGSTTPLSDLTAGGTWSSGSAHATVGSTGIVTGVSAGTAVISYIEGSGCYSIATVTVNTTPGAINPAVVTICLGGTTTLTDGTPGGTWSSSNTGVATIGTGGLVTGAGTGTSTISYTVAGCSAINTITVNTAPVAITPATATVCTGSTTNLTDATAGGVWSASNGNATVSGTGVVSGVTAGAVTIYYAIGTCSVSASVTVNATPGAINPAIVTVCLGGTTTLTDATAGGVWSSSNTGVATIGTGGLVTAVGTGTSTISYTLAGCTAVNTITVNSAPVAITPATATVCTGSTTNLTDATTGGVWTASNGNATVSGSGVVTGVTAGAVVISYSIGTCSSTANVTVNATPGVINPTVTTICLGGTTTLTDGTPGGAWSSSNTGVATIGTGGLVTAVGTGTSTISYTVSGCSAVNIITVNSAPVAITPATATVCTGSTTNLTDPTTGGVWTASNGNATVSGTGVVTGVTAGAVVISYSIGTCSSTANVTVNATPGVINPTVTTICLGGTTALTDATAGGTWSSSNTGVATIGTGGLVTTVGTGTSIISYTSSGCTVTNTITVNTAPVAITPATATVCTGATTNLTDATSGGVWTSSNGNATVSGTGVVTGVTVGVSTISYSIGTCYSTATVTVNAGVAAISPATASLCVGNTVTLNDATGGGVWSSSNGNATVVGGTVTAVTTGTATISYTLGSCSSTALITISSTPSAISPATANVCIGNTVTMSDAVSGGVWSSSNGNVSVVGGTVLGITNGTSTISYTIGTCYATATVTVNPGTSAGTITGPTNILCPGTSINLTDAVTGGVWTASNGNATVDATGLVTGVIVGTDVISYTVSAACGSATTLTTVTISAAASSGTIIGPLTVCVGSFDIYLDYTTGGTWSVSNANGVISPVGVLTAIAAGPETIIYTEPGACTQSTLNITIIPSTIGAGTITGPTSVCIGSSITLSDAAAPGGTWTSTNGHASVGTGSGIVTGITAGLDTVIYSITTACGTYTTSATVNVDATATPSPISGPSSACVASTILLTDAELGGAWSSSNGHATVLPGIGLVTGVTPGLDTITYSVTNGCGFGSTTKVITVIPSPSAGTITGPTSVCPSASITLSDAVTGGTWSEGNGNATIGSSTGVVTGVTAGTDVITYTITAACGTVSTTAVITISPLPDASTVLGPDSLCVGSTITLLDFAPGGVWSAGNANATVSATGVVTGVSIGTDPISYTVTNGCGSSYAMKIVTVLDLPNAGVITGISDVCVGSAITLSDTVAGGLWLSSNGNASIIGPGIISGVTTGIDSIFYVVTNICGTNEARKIINVDPVPVVAAITGPSSQCVGSTVTFNDATPGGVWTGSDATIVNVNLSTGGVTGVATGDATISYTVTNGFGCPTTVSAPDTVLTTPVVSAIMGNSSLCLTTSVTLSDTTAGGAWSSSDNTIATVDAFGNVTSVAAGVATISYTVTNICSATSATLAVTVNPLPIVSGIFGTTSICVGANTTLTNTTSGGVWSSSDNTIASIDPVTGVVTGVSAGGVTIFYSVTNTFGCNSTVSVLFTVNAGPAVAAITGVTNECLGSGTTLADITLGGVWSSSDNTIATVDAFGNVSSVAGGVVTISYTVTNGSGCSASATTPDTVSVTPVSSPVMGTMEFCANSSTSLSDAIAGGAWSSNDNTVATVDAVSGIVSGVAAGTDLIIYTVTNACGSVADTATITVDAVPVVSPITAAFTSICIGSSITLNDATPAGAWSTSDPTVATVSSTGVVTSVSTGTATITYTVSNISGCSDFATLTVTVATSIAGVDVVPASATLCHGSAVNMHISTAISGMTYQWLLNGNIIPGATDASYTTDTAGNYSLEVGNGICSQTITGPVVSNQPNPVIGFNAPNVLYTGSGYFYQWYKNGVAIPGATSSTYYETGSGYYTVVVTDINGCSVTSGGYTVTGGGGGGGGTAVNNVSANTNIRIYPNPATSVLTVDAPAKVNVSLLSVDGKLLIEQKDAHNIDISQLANGMYLIMIYDENNMLLNTSKFVKTEQ